uniref:Putative secreted protein n=1 Tax=Ixodes ricinus TaxID=34613 RepID=A0A6B0UY07_IXORI
MRLLGGMLSPAAVRRLALLLPAVQPIVGLPEAVRQSMAVRGRLPALLGAECTCAPPLACLTLAVAVPIPKEVLAVEAGDLLSILNVPEHLHARRVAARGHKLAIGATVVVNEGRRSEPKLSAVLPARVHDAEVVLPRAQQLTLFFFGKLGNAAHEVRYLFVLVPFFGST